MIEFTRGDVFTTPADILVNPVNCVGVMGAGLALAFKQRYPAMFKAYQEACAAGEVRPGHLHIWRSPWIINFPTKRHWRDASRYEDVATGLGALRACLAPLGPVTVALPALGCGRGGLDWLRVRRLIQAKLQDLPATIRVYAPFDSGRGGGA
jgi:O-acetyl-ADP-ribose deacetylase (regulator of RNase III)